MSDRQEESAHRKARIVELRRARLTFDAIGRELGISLQRAHQLYRQALAEFPNVQVAEHREEETALIDRAISRLMGIAEDETVTPRTRVEAWTAVRGWCQHKAALLGLNAPVRKEVTVLTESVVDQALAQASAEHAAKVAELEALERRAIEGGG